MGAEVALRPLGIQFFYPKNLPALVTMVYLEDGDIRESFFRRLDPTEPSQSSVGKWSQHVGGFLASFNIGKALPVRMTVCWDSVIDKKAYETEIWFSRDTWQQMLTAYPDTYRPGKIYYRNKMIIGLPPGGKVRVWLKDNRNPVVLQNPARQFTLPGICSQGNDSNLLIVFYVQIMPDDLVMQLHRF
ncbi:TPA: DUF2931 family protein [Escherichia coli]